MDSLNNLAVILGSDVGDGSADGLLEGVRVLEAALQISLIVVASESVDESSEEVSDFEGVEGEVSAGDGGSEWVAHVKDGKKDSI